MVVIGLVVKYDILSDMKTHIKISCLNCEKFFLKELRYVKRGEGKFCSRKCFGEYNGKKVIEHYKLNKINNCKCANTKCGKEFYRTEHKKYKTSKSRIIFCSRECKDDSQRIGGIKEIQPPHYGTTLQDYRVIVFSIYNMPKCCNRCKYDKNEAAIVVHHKDRDRKNNNIDNLEVLCANCHAIEHWGEENM